MATPTLITLSAMTPRPTPDPALHPVITSIAAAVDTVAALAELAGFLLGMLAYSGAARPFWLEACGGRSYRVERQKHPDPIVVNHLVVSWFGTIQPDRLTEVLEKADDGWRP
jgi:hypothetical protein